MPPAEFGPRILDTVNALIAVVVLGLVLVGYRTVVYFQLRCITAALIAKQVPIGVSATCLGLGIGSGGSDAIKWFTSSSPDVVCTTTASSESAQPTAI